MQFIRKGNTEFCSTYMHISYIHIMHVCMCVLHLCLLVRMCSKDVPPAYLIVGLDGQTVMSKHLEATVVSYQVSFTLVPDQKLHD